MFVPILEKQYTVQTKNSRTLKYVRAKFYTSFELHFIYMVSIVIVYAFILCHTNVKVLVLI